MSGYDPKTNIFELTGTKVRYWLRRDALPDGMVLDEDSCDGIEIQLFRHFGIKVLFDGGNYMAVQGTPEEIWTALSGEESTPENAQHYYDNPVDNSRHLKQRYVPIMNDCRFEKYEAATKRQICDDLGITAYRFDKRKQEENIEPVGYKKLARGVAYFYDKADWV